MPVSIAGVMPVSTTFLASIPTGVPRKSSAGILKAACSPSVISYISSVVSTASRAVPPTNWTMAGAAASAKAPSPAVSVMAFGLPGAELAPVAIVPGRAAGEDLRRLEDSAIDSWLAFVDPFSVNTENLVRAFLEGDPTSHEWAQSVRFSDDSVNYAQEALASGRYNGTTGTIDLTFGGVADPRAACGGWRTADGDINPPNCGYLIAAEERFGDGDHLFSVEEQRRASTAYWLTQVSATRFSAPGRSLRIGAQIGF